MGLAQDIAAALHAARESIAEARAAVLAANETVAAARDRLASVTDGTGRAEPVRALAALEQSGQHGRQAVAAMSTCDEQVGGYVADVLGMGRAATRRSGGVTSPGSAR